MVESRHAFDWLSIGRMVEDHARTSATSGAGATFPLKDFALAQFSEKRDGLFVAGPLGGLRFFMFTKNYKEVSGV